MNSAELIFWLAVFFVFYAFLGYPLLLWAIAFVLPNRANKQYGLDHYGNAITSDLPRVTLIISVYNEENVIEEKLQNALQLDYPKDRMELLVVSDASSDRTDDKVRNFASQGVRWLRQDTRSGKTAALNMALPQASGEIIIFSDANSMYDKNAIGNLVRHFKDTSLGFVTGRTKYISKDKDTVSESTNLYTTLELKTKKLESKIFSCVGADGAIFAIRKRLFKPLQDYDINDFVIPLNIIEQGFRGILDSNAFCIEETARDTGGEFNRQVRITCRTIRAIFNNKVLLNPFKYPLFSFELLSHKILKFMLPFFMIFAFVVNIPLISASILYAVVFMIQLFYYVLFLYGYCERKKKDGNRFAGLAYTFGTVSLALLVGWVKFILGETYTTWSSERS